MQTPNFQYPAAETPIRQKIEETLKHLFENAYLYQNKKIVPSELFPSDKLTASLIDELEHRPWEPVSRNKGYTADELRIMTHSRGGFALDAEPRTVPIKFEIPSADLYCNVCKKIEIHNSVPHIEWSPYHLNESAIKEQIGFKTHLFNLQCAKCQSAPITIMIRRELLKVQIVGRSQALFPEIPKFIPKGIEEIYQDAVQAAVCGDWNGACYHLRTLLEHYMKEQCNITLETRMEGSELCERYNKVIDPVLSQKASITTVYTDTSINLHTRSGDKARFEKLRATVEKHFKLAHALKEIG